MANMFANAKAVTQEKPKPGKKAKVEVTVKGLEQYAMIDSLVKTLESMKKSVGAEIKDIVADEFVKVGTEHKKGPESFRGVENAGSASVELRKRSTASVLTADEQAYLTDHKIGFETIVDTPATFIINPKYAADMKLLELVSTALDGKVPEDFIQAQAEVKRTVASETSMDQIFQKGINDPDVMKQLMLTVGTLALKPKVTGKSVKEMLKAVLASLDEDKEETQTAE